MRLRRWFAYRAALRALVAKHEGSGHEISPPRMNALRREAQGSVTPPE
jgi:hypothetical protein